MCVCVGVFVSVQGDRNHSGGIFVVFLLAGTCVLALYEGRNRVDAGGEQVLL